MGKPILMDFSADWCGPCRTMVAVMQALEKEYDGRAEIRAVNVDREMEMASKHGIFVVPTLILEKDGVEIRRWMGVTSKEELKAALDLALE